MAKKLVITLLSITIIACSSISVFATEDVADKTNNTGNQVTQAAENAPEKITTKAVTRTVSTASVSKTTKQKNGMAAYIRKSNRSISKSKSLKLAKYFYDAGKKYNVDVYYLMAIAKNESNFKTSARSAGGTYRGIMQTSKAMGRYFGYSPSQLYNGRIGIIVGARCLKSNLRIFNYNYKKGLSAYAYGSGTVKSGNYSTYYYKKFKSNRTAIINYLKSRNYI